MTINPKLKTNIDYRIRNNKTHKLTNCKYSEDRYQ